MTPLSGDNDPANFGGVAVAMMNLVHTATFSNWSSVALISFYGCDKFGGNGTWAALEKKEISEHNMQSVV